MKFVFVALQSLMVFLLQAQGSLPVRSFAPFTHNNILISLSGKVTDSLTGLPLPGASVYFVEERVGAVAGADGRYVLKNIPTGHHLIEVSYSGYNTLVDHVDITGEQELNFALTPSITENQGVTVTGVANATNIRNTAIPITLIKKAQLLQTPSTNIIDALSKQPGIAQVSTGPAISKPVIRGLGYNRVVIVNDGIRQEGQQWGDEHGIEIDEMSVARAEILKGPASLTYGSDALAGVINFITNVPVAAGTVKGNIYSSYQTNNGQYGLNANVAGNINGFNWNVYGSTKSAKDYSNKWDGRVLNSRFNERNFGGYMGFNKSWGFSHLIFSTFNQNLGLVEGTRDSASGKFLLFAESPLQRIATPEDLDSRKLFVPSQNVQHYKLIADNSFKIGASRLKLNVGYQDNLRKEFGNPEDPSETALYFDLKTLSYSTQYVMRERNNWQTSMGVSGMYQNNQNKGSEQIIPEYNLFDVGGFVFTQKQFSKLTFSSGLRFDNRHINSLQLIEGSTVKFAPFTKSFSNISGSAGISYVPTDNITIKANIARGFRAPTLSELASNGAHEGTNRYEHGQQNLGSEVSTQGDVGLQLDYQHVSFTVNGFYNKINDFIFYRRLKGAMGADSVINLGGVNLEAFQYSQNNATLAGMEASIDIHPHPLDWLHFENTFSFVHGRFNEAIDGSTNLPMIPPARWMSELRVNFAKQVKGLHNLYASTAMENTFAQNRAFTGYNTETATPGYVLFNAGVGADVMQHDKTLFSLHVAVSNLTDKTYQNHLSRLKYTDVNNATGRQGVYNMGRNFSIKLNVPLNFYGKM